MKLRIVDIIVAFLLVFILINNLTNREKETTEALDSVKEYLVDVEKKGKKTVVILVTGTTYINEEPLEFIDRKLLEITKRELGRANYTIITLSTPCAVRCLDDYTRLGILIKNLEPTAVIYKGIHTDFGTETLNSIITKANVPIFTFGSEVVLDYELYVGPDNFKIGEAIVEGLKDKIKEGDEAIYIETVSKLNNDKLDNGFERIDTARKGLSLLGVKEKKTIATLWSKGQTYEEILNILKKGEVEYIIAPSVETAEGAILAIEKVGYSTKDIKVIGVDLTERSIELIKNNRLYGVVSQELSIQGLELADAIISSYKGEKSKRLYASKLITLDNLDEYMLSNNNYKW